MEQSAQTPDLREELRSDTATIADSAKEKLHGEVDARKGTAATQAKSLSSALDAAAGELSDSPTWLRNAFQQGAQTLGRFAESIDQKDSRQLTRDIKQLARDNPATFLAGCAAAGFAAARVMKAGVEDTSSAQGSATYDPYEQTGPGGTAFGGMSQSRPSMQPAYQGEE